jgi:hypothetical protein
MPAEDLGRDILVRAETGAATHAFTADCRAIRFSAGYPVDGGGPPGDPPPARDRVAAGDRARRRAARRGVGE